MSTYRFQDWYARQYDNPKIGLVQPGDERELDSAPADGHWTLVSVNTDTVQDSTDVRESGHDADTTEVSTPVDNEHEEKAEELADVAGDVLPVEVTE